MNVPSTKTKKRKSKIIRKTPLPIEHHYELNQFTNEIPINIEIVNKITKITAKLSSVFENVFAKRYFLKSSYIQ